MYYRVDTPKQFLGKVAGVAEILPIEHGFGKDAGRREAVCEEAAVVPDELCLWKLGTQMLDKNRADVAHVAGYEETNGRSPGAIKGREVPGWV